MKPISRLTTIVGPVKTLILEKQSFSSPEDPNYQSVKCALRSIVDSVRCSNEHQCEGRGVTMSCPPSRSGSLSLGPPQMTLLVSEPVGNQGVPDHTRQSRP